ncbi:MAG: Calx-beta domain-containing protein [Bacteroidia bacterium]
MKSTLRLFVAGAMLFALSTETRAQGPSNNPATPGAATISAKNTPYFQNFDGLDITGTNQINLPVGWQTSESGSGGRYNGGYAADNGAGTSGDLISYGATSTTDRALGTLLSSSIAPRFGVFVKNTTGSVVDSVRIEFTLEQWRCGTINRTDSFIVEYNINRGGIDTNAVNNSGWSRFPNLLLNGKTYTATGALDGNIAANQTRFTAMLTGITLNNNDTLVIRFVDYNATGSDDGMAIDSFSMIFDPLILTPQPVTGINVTPTLTTAGVNYTAPGNFSSATQQFVAFLKQGTAITAGTPTMNPAGYTANSDFSANGTAYQNDAAAKCVYKGTGTNFNVTGLQANTAYHLMILTVSTADSVYSSGATAQFSSGRTTINFTAKSGSQIEGAVSNIISVSIANPSTTVTDTTFVELQLTGGDATNGVDLATTFNTTVLKFPGNSTSAQTVSFGITNDNTDEWNETLQFTLRNVSGGAAATIGADSLFTYTIVDNDGIANPASGDIAFTQVQATSSTGVFDNSEFITLKRLDLRNMGVTDRGVLTDGALSTTESVYNLPTTSALADVPAGTVVRFVATTGTDDTNWADGIMTFYTTAMNLSTGGDQIIAFTGFNNYVAGINFANSGWTSGSTNTNTSKAPGTLADLHAGTKPNVRFKGMVSGAASLLRDSLINVSSWDTSATRFATDFATFTSQFNEPASQATNLTVAGTSLSNITLSWKASAAAQRYAVVMNTSSTISNPADSFTYNNTNNYNQADTVILSASAMTKGNGRVVYSGHDTMVVVNGLANGTRYYYKVFALNGNGSNANYNANSPLSGDTTTQNPVVPVVKFGTLSTTTSEDSTSIKIPVSLTNSTNTAVSVSVAIKGGTATSTSDYQLGAASINFSGNADTTTHVTVTIVNDNLVEGAENVVLVLQNISSPAILDADSVHTLTINDNDFTKIGFEVNRQTIAETIDTARIRVVMKDLGPNAPYTVNVSATPLTATATQDYALITTSLTFSGAADSVKTVLVKVFNTLPLEANESFVLQLSSPSTGAALDVNATDTITINNFSYPYYPIGQINKTDANGVLDSAGRRYEVRGIVYGVNIRTTGLQFTIHDGTGGLGTFNTPATFGYTVKEGDSIILFGRLNQFNGLAQIEAIDTIIVAGTNKATKAPVTVSALSEATESEYVMFPSLTLAPSANWPVTPFTGTGRNMYAYVNGNPADSIQIRIVVTSPLNGSPRPTEKFAMIGIGGQFDNSNPFTSGHQLFPMFLNHIINGDTVGFTTASATVNEAAGTVNISVSLKNPTALPTTVQVAVNGGSAAGSSDYTYTTQTVTFPANSNAAQTVTLSITDDNLFESNETIAFTLQNATNNATIDPAAGAYIITITDNDPNGVKELNAVQFNVYPNPAREVLNIAADKEMNSVVVTDIIGNVVLNVNDVNAKKATLNTASLNAGVYFVRVYSAEGSSVKKVIIK